MEEARQMRRRLEALDASFSEEDHEIMPTPVVQPPGGVPEVMEVEAR